MTHHYPRAGGFSDDVRLAVQGATETIHAFLVKVMKGYGDATVGQAVIRRAYYQFSSRSNGFPYSTCPFGPNSLSTNPVEVIFA